MSTHTLLSIKKLNKLSELLGDIVENPHNYTEGICVVVYNRLSYRSMQYIQHILSLWPKASRHTLYPIPAPTGFCEFKDYPDPCAKAYKVLPKYRGEYGELRIEACIWLIHRINDELRKRV